MKKYLIFSIGSITISIILVIQLYKTADIGFVDAIVESTTNALGVKSTFVEKKIERKKQEEAIKVETVTNPLAELRTKEDEATNIKNEERLKTISDSIALVEKEKSTKKIFNLKVDEVAINKIKVEEQLKIKAKRESDSLILLAEATKPKKKSLFNSNIAATEKKSTETNLVFFEAKVHGSQKFNDNQSVTFRTSNAVTIGSKTLPQNYVFNTKANVFDGKVHFVLKDIDSAPVNGENYASDQPGQAITSEMKLGSSYMVSDGMMVKFGVKVQ